MIDHEDEKQQQKGDPKWGTPDAVKGILLRQVHGEGEPVAVLRQPVDKEEEEHRKHHETYLDLIDHIYEDVFIVDVPIEDHENEDHSEEEEEVQRQGEVLEVFLIG